MLLPYILLFLIAFTIVGFLVQANFYNLILNRNNSYAKSTLYQVNVNLENSLRQIDDKMVGFYNAEYFDYNLVYYLNRIIKNQDSPTINDEKVVNRQISYLKESNKNIEGVIIKTYEPNFVFSTLPTSIKLSYNFDDYKYINEIKARGYQLFVSPVSKPDYYINYSGKVITLARNIKDINLVDNIGVVLVDIDIGIFRDIFKQYENELKGDIIFLDRNSNVYFNLKETLSGKTPPFKINLDINSKEKGPIMKEIWIQNQKYYLYALKSECINGFITYLLPESDVLEGFSSIKNNIILIMLISIFFASILSIIISKIFSKRISQLAAFVVKIGKGQFDARIKIGSEDEIAHLGVSFNEMGQKLKEYIDKVYIAELKNKELEIKENALELKEKNSELKALQMQINPHFLFNTLETIKMNIKLGNSQGATEMLRILACIFRWNVKGGPSIVTLDEEINYTMLYLDLQKIRFKDKLKVVCEIDQEVRKCKVIKLILQPIVENAVIYGIEGKIGMGTILLKAFRVDDKILIQIIDDGPGIDQEKLAKLKHNIYSNSQITDSYSIGLKNVHERISKSFGINYGLEISSEKSGTKVCISIPFSNL